MENILPMVIGTLPLVSRDQTFFSAGRYLLAPYKALKRGLVTIDHSTLLLELIVEDRKLNGKLNFRVARPDASFNVFPPSYAHETRNLHGAKK